MLKSIHSDRTWKERIMDKRVGGRKSWHINTLIRRALESSENVHSYWNCVYELHVRGNDEVFQQAEKLCRNTGTTEKILGIDILAQLGIGDKPYRGKSLTIIRSFLDPQTNPKILNSALVAIGHLQNSDDTKGIRKISAFADHKSEDVRFGVVRALMTHEDRVSITTLIRLTRDKSAEVRDWATFALGSQIDTDTPAIRKALIGRLDDSDCDTRCEAILGLAIRKDKRVLHVLQQELMKSSPTSLIFEAAEEYGDKSLLPLIEKQILSINDQTCDMWIANVKDARDNLSASS
jgi:hypothetical protein